MQNLKVFIVLFVLLSSIACSKDNSPRFEIHFWELNNQEVGTESYFDKNDIVKIKVSGGTTNNENLDRKISHFSFGLEIDGEQGDAVGEVDQDADNVTLTYILDLQETFKGGSVYNCKGGEEILLYLEMVDYNGNAETYTHTLFVE